MLCPHCGAENRDDRASCYHCGKDLSLLRLMIGKARGHYNSAAEHVEHGRYYEALGELNSALELNAGLGEAHVLRGDVLARLERPAEARDAFESALTLTPQAARAHRHLGELGEVERSLPILGRLRGVLVGVGAALGVAAIFATIGIHMILGGNTQEQKAWRALQRGDLAESARIGGSLRDEAGKNEIMRMVALAVDTRMDAAARLADSGQYAAAQAQLADLQKMTLSPDAAKSADRQSAAVRKAMLREIGGGYDAALQDATQSGTIAPVRASALEAKGHEFEQLFASQQDEFRQLKNAFSEKLRDSAARQADLSQAMLEKGDTSTTATASLRRAYDIVELSKEYTVAEGADPAEELSKRIERLAKIDADNILLRAQDAANRSDRKSFDAFEDQLKSLPNASEEPLEQMAALRGVFTEQEKARVARDVAKAIADENWERAIAAADASGGASITFDPETTQQIARARSMLALKSYYALMTEAEAIEAGKLGAAEAREVLRLIERAMGPLPPRVQSRARESLHFFAARAHESLGEKAEAEADMKRLREEYPQSAYLK
ncbi:hypothetical protein BH09SUM1_BH09SUM1_23020 [soil metagenome]